MHPRLLDDIGIAIIAATVVGILAHRLRQPIILGYLVAGAIIGPEVGFKWVRDLENIEIISEIGLILLLFIIGLEMNLQKLLASGRQLLLAGGGQFILCVALGLGFFPLIGYRLFGPPSDGLYLALICALSSTAIVVKLLYDKFEIDTIPGRITVGVLVIQDIFAIFVLAFQPNFSNPDLTLVAKALAGTVALLVAGFLLSKWLLKAVFGWIAKTPEMVVAVSIGWCALVAGSASLLGLSKEMGALIAGLCISAFPYSVHVTAKTLPLRDFFLTLFFISLGMKITAPTPMMAVAVPAIVLFVILSRLLTVYPLLAWSGAGRRTGFIVAVNLAQISEFSLVIAALGVSPHKHIGSELMAVIIYAMATTSVLSSYAIKYSHQLYRIFDRGLGLVGLKSGAVEAAEEDGHHLHDVVVLGYHRSARALVERLGEAGPGRLHQLLVIDFNLEVLAELKSRGVAGLFGDIGSMDTLKHAHLESARLVVLTIPDMLLKGTSNLAMVRACRALAPKAAIVATADSLEQAELLKVAGANHVLMPYGMVGGEVARLIEESATAEG